MIKDYIEKGDKLGVKGRLQIRYYEDKEGNKRTTSEVIVEQLEFLESKKKEVKEEVKEETDPFIDFGNTIELTDDDIAF